VAERGLPADSIHLAHSYERVMPGPDYLLSITHFWRVYAGIDVQSGDLCEAFLRKVIDTEKYPLTRLPHPTASELGKVLENSYRATNIAFIEEWSRFAEAVGVDIYGVVDAIRMRPTHNNLRQPGFGVGGYCLVKDPWLGRVAARQIFSLPDLQFPFSEMALETNRRMPLVSIEILAGLWPERLRGKKLLLLGVSYRSDVGDTRYSPAEIFYRAASEAGAEVTAYDPMVTHWAELDLPLPASLPKPEAFDAIVFSVAHREFLDLDLLAWLGKSRPVILDANRVLPAKRLAELQAAGFVCRGVGRGDLS
jgi:nucleotide sugar dehydrogenase